MKASILFAMAIAAAPAMAQDGWEREVYREVSLTSYANYGLFSPRTNVSDEQGIFHTLMRLALTKTVPVYAYAIDGVESLTPSGRVEIEDIRDGFAIPYTTGGEGGVTVRPEDMPSAEVRTYYVRERAYYDKESSQMRREVVALCPVMESQDAADAGLTRYPMFWVDYRDVEPYLRKTDIVADYRNTASWMRASDYFALSLYEGRIYMERTPQGLALGYGQDDETAADRERQRVERELETVRARTFDIFHDVKKPLSRKELRRQKRAEKAALKKAKAKRNAIAREESGTPERRTLRDLFRKKGSAYDPNAPEQAAVTDNNSDKM